MLKKLLKYDLKWMLKVVVIYLALGCGLAVIGKLIELLPNSTFFTIIEGICKGAATSLLITAIVNGVIRSWVRIVNNVYKDEGYITNTLPIKTELHLVSKVISSLIVIIVSTIVLFAMLALMYLNKDNIDLLVESLNTISELSNTSSIIFILLIAALLLLEILFIVIIGFFGIVYGHSFNNAKLAKSFLIALIAYAVNQVILCVLLIIVSIFNSDLYEVLFNDSQFMNFNTIKFITIGTIIYYFVICGLWYYLAHKKIKKGINID